MATALLSSSCSLLFEATSEGPCSDSLDQTLSFYPVADNTTELVDVHNLANGQPYLGRELSTMTGIKPIQGPCGSALSFAAPSSADRWFIQIESDSHRVVPLSVDFWVDFAAEIQGNTAGILTRDQQNSHHGDLEISQIQDGDKSRILIRTQSATQERFACSGPLDRETWHHVAVSIDDGMTVQLFVDGARIEQVGETVAVGSSSVPCEDGNFGAGVNMSQNAWPWIVGASNSASSSATPRIGEFLIGGAVDNLRIRNAVFTAEEAAAFSP